jgi:sulfite reductase (NADPH) hemoprotein beta-component
VYNQYGRRDNIYKARIKILVKAIGIEEFRRQVEEEWQNIQDGPGTLTVEEVNRVAAFFTTPAYETLSATDAAFEKNKAENKAFNNWLARNVKDHKFPGYAAVVLSLKKTGVPPGDATAEQMDFIADLADRYSFGELRVTHEQNLVLSDVKLSDLFTVWQEAKAHGLATPNIGLLTDIICCPGGDFCSLANAKSIPIAEAIAARFDDLDFQHDIGDIELNISGCINACGHHHVGNIGILGVDKDGSEWYQVSIGGAQGNESSIGKIIGPSFSAHQMPTVIERLLQVYVRDRIEDERFIDTARRIGVAPFKEHVYATPITIDHPAGEDAYA